MQGTSAAAGAPIIEVNDLVKVYKGGTRAVDGVSFRVGDGEFFGFLGPNGAGKTTTIRILATLLRPTSGSAAVAGIDVLAHPGEVRKQVGFAMQTVAVDPLATGRENLELIGRLRRVPGPQLRARIDELLVLMKLTESQKKVVGTYSGGMKRRLDLATALLHRPRVLFLDEPTEGLDPQSRNALWEELESVNQSGTTMFLTTHYMEEADRLCKRIAIVDEGKIVVEGTPAELKRTVGNDVVELQLEADGPEELERQRSGIGRMLEGFEPVAEIKPSPGGIQLYVSNAAAAIPELVRRLDGDGVRIGALTMHQPSLDDVFLRYTGKTIREEQANVHFTGWY
ncbi:MAG: ATP-binding cassette domain-containing protein [Chloroflexota bacterium]